MGTIVNLRRVERLEARMGVGANWVRNLTDAQLDGLILAAGTGEMCCDDVEGAASYVEKNLKDIALRYSNYPDGFGSIDPDGFDGLLDVLQELGAPKAAAMLVEAVREERLSAPYLWKDWRMGLSKNVVAMLEGTEAFRGHREAR